MPVITVILLHPSRSAYHRYESRMEQSEIFSRKIRWLAIAVGIAVAALFSFLSPLAAAVPLLLPLAVVLQPSLSDLGRRLVMWFVWVWALGWTPGLVALSIQGVPDILHRTTHDFVVLSVLSLMAVSVLLILWWDIELIIDGVRRIRIWRSAPGQRALPVSLVQWILAAVLTLWSGWVLIRTIGIYHGVGDIYALVMSIVEVVIAVAFDFYLTWRIAKLRRNRA